MRPPLLESPPEAGRGPSVEVIILRLFPLIKVPAFLFAPGAAAPEPRTPGLSRREGAGAVSSPTGGQAGSSGGVVGPLPGRGARGLLWVLGIGGPERWVAYPIILLTVGFGGHLMGLGPSGRSGSE